MSRRRLACLTFVLSVVGILAATSPLTASIVPARLKELRERADLYERQGDWEKACELYEAILKADRSLSDIRHRYHHSLRRYWQTHRHRDPGFRKEVLGLEYGQAMKLYGLIQQTLLKESLERSKLNAAGLFRKGLEELRWALTDPTFCQFHVSAAKFLEIRAFVDVLDKTWGNANIRSADEAQKQVREVALAAHALLGLNATTVILEFACGACHALDEHTVYLTPSQFRELCLSLKGETVGIGLVLVAEDNRVTIAEVIAGSPAAEIMPPLTAGDIVLRIDKKPVNQMPAEMVQEMLEGPAGSQVEVTVQSIMFGTRQLSLRRRAILAPSVSYRVESANVGYLRISSFQESTLQELDFALLTLSRSDIKALIVDLRGNGGGLFEVAIDVARRFLSSGTIATLQTLDSRQNIVYQSRNPEALALPLVVLVDGDTASAAEVLAGALKENKRGRLVGESTFGKGCTQSILKLPTGPGGVPTGGLRLTVARFFSPSGAPYSGRGVIPHLIVSDSTPDAQLEEARFEVQRLLEMSGQ